jgi:hypothetical protein
MRSGTLAQKQQMRSCKTRTPLLADRHPPSSIRMQDIIVKSLQNVFTRVMVASGRMMFSNSEKLKRASGQLLRSLALLSIILRSIE